jgi:hypothetical protein
MVSDFHCASMLWERILFIEYLGKELPVKCFIERELDFSSFSV